jgi:hypothetical protein
MCLIYAGLPTERTTNLRTNLRLRIAAMHRRFEAGGAAALYRQSGPGSNTEERRARSRGAAGRLRAAVAALDEGEKQ